MLGVAAQLVGEQAGHRPGAEHATDGFVVHGEERRQGIHGPFLVAEAVAVRSTVGQHWVRHHVQMLGEAPSRDHALVGQKTDAIPPA